MISKAPEHSQNDVIKGKSPNRCFRVTELYNLPTSIFFSKLTLNASR